MSDTIDFEHLHETDNRVTSSFEGEEKESRLHISHCPRRGRLPVLGLQAVDQHGIRRVLDCLDHRVIARFGCTDRDWRGNLRTSYSEGFIACSWRAIRTVCTGNPAMSLSRPAPSRGKEFLR